MEEIIQGAIQFQKNLLKKQEEMFKSLVKHGQHPKAVFITCSDSRIDHCMITQSKPGDLFVIRNAGNLVPPYTANPGGEIASIEFAVNGLGIQDIIVCGHSHCGAMQGLLDTQKLDNSPSLKAWLTHAAATREVIQEKYESLSGELRLQAAVQENVLIQLEHLKTHPAVAAKLASGQLRLHGWVYLLETGEMLAYDPMQDDFVPLAQAYPFSIATLHPVLQASS